MWGIVGKCVLLPSLSIRKAMPMVRFLGNIEAKTDAKGRIFLPAVFRKQLQAAGEERLVLRKDVFQGLPGALSRERVVCHAGQPARQAQQVEPPSSRPSFASL